MKVLSIIAFIAAMTTLSGCSTALYPEKDRETSFLVLEAVEVSVASDKAPVGTLTLMPGTRIRVWAIDEPSKETPLIPTKGPIQLAEGGRYGRHAGQ